MTPTPVRRPILMALAAVAVAAMVSTPLAAPVASAAPAAVATAAPTVTRIAGADRYDVSARISAATFAPGAPVAYVATGEVFADALSGAPAAGVDGGPVLLVQRSTIPASVAGELTRLKPQRIVVLGGTGSVSAAVMSALGAYTTGTVTRLAGRDRFDVSARISAATFSPGASVAYVATGQVFADALSGAPAGGSLGGPVLLVQPTAIPGSVADELSRLKPQRIVVLGGTASVSAAVMSRLGGFTSGSVTRYSGADRYDVSARISANTFGPGAPVAYVATGENFPDALSGAPAGGVIGGPVLLVRSTSVPSSVAKELARLKPQRIVVLGGTASVSGPVAMELASSGARPDASNTGVPAGTTLTPSPGMTITRDNTVIDGRDINGPVVVQAANVTIRRSKIHGSGSESFGVSVRSGSVVIEDTEIYGFANGIGFSNWSATRVDLHDLSDDGVKLGSNVLLQDSWIHGMTPSAGAHADGGQMQDGVRNLVVRNNTIDLGGTRGANAALFLAPDLGPSTPGPVTISGNWLDGGNYSLFVLDGNNGQYFVSNITITNNRFGRRFAYGPAMTNVPFTQSGNVWADTGAALRL
ncbi:MAG: cell wall-binding repeat-containing protein [Micrococcales bacterium]|nr:cell wall-binding repeat-containing protein [Micrococcales bacterium]